MTKETPLSELICSNMGIIPVTYLPIIISIMLKKKNHISSVTLCGHKAYAFERTGIVMLQVC